MMLGNDSVPRPPRSSRAFEEFGDANGSMESERNTPKRPNNESPFDSFTKIRQDATGTETARVRRRSPKSDGRRKSKSPSNASQDSVPGTRSRSPRNSKYKKSPSAPRSPGYMSPSSKSPGNRKSPRLKGDNYLSADAKNQLDGSFPDLGSTPKIGERKRNQSDDDDDSLPALIDDSVVRERVEGFRGGKQWNILEDTPGGHAVEKLVIIPGIECFNDEDEWLEEDEDVEEDEDEDIVDDQLLIDPHSQSNWNNRRQTLPNDPSAKRGVATQIRKISAGRDRFDPSFKNNDMWATDDDEDVKLSRSHSGDVSILSDHMADLDTVSELGLGSCAFTDDQSLTISTEEASRRKNGRDINPRDDDTNPSSVDISKTPATTKRSGGRPYNVGGMERLPNLGGSSRGNGYEDDDSLKHPASVPEDAPLGTAKRRGRRKKKSNTPELPSSKQPFSSNRPPSSYERAKASNNNNSGRSSSNRRSAHTHSGSRSRTAAGMERNAMRSSRGGRKIPDVVPATPVRETASWMRCSPMSSSLTSTPTSLVSSMQQQQQASLQHLRARRRKNKPLHAHVGREASPPPDDTDDNTLGASTITTNFSTTQRTRGENTVSTRSLFRSDQMSHSETLKIPQRKKEDSDYEHGEDDHSSTMIDEVEELHGSAEIGNHIESSYEILESAKPAPEGTFKTLLRRPSGEGDNMLGAFDLKSSDEGSDCNSNASDLFRWQKENENLISPTADLKKTIEPGANAFLELSIDDNGVQVDSKVSEVADFNTPLQISGSIDETKPADLGKNYEDEAPTKFEVQDAPQMRQKNGEIMRAPDSPLDRLGKKKKPKGGRLGLFKRVQSWKGAVALSDEED